MKLSSLLKELQKGTFNAPLRMLNCTENISAQIQRYEQLINEAIEIYGDLDGHLISAPGRSEIGGNHTDHQLGRVLAASVTMDIAAVAIKSNDYCEYKSKDFMVDPVDINDLSVKDDEKFTSSALIRGILARFKELGYNIGGFKVYSHSEVLKGSGISSSAAFETLIGTILSELYNEGKVGPIEIAKIGQYAENVYFGKPCGLMDQMATSVGGFVFIDFYNKEKPVVKQIDYDFGHSGYSLCLVDTKGNHADLSDEYGLMPQEMKDVAHYFNEEYLSRITMEQFLSNVKDLRTKVSDRAILRAYHFLCETNRVLKQKQALENNDFEEFKQLIIESGYSSYMYLQNVYSNLDVKHQELAIALAVSEHMLKGQGAYRVHGGGLAGTIQAFVPNSLLNDYKNQMNAIFGEGSCHILSIRPKGGYRIV